MNVIFLPIEPLEERYSAQMLRWVENALKKADVDYRVVLPVSTYDVIAHGQWLDTYGTTRYRNDQMNLVVKQFEQGFVHNGDIFLIGDVWYPGIEAIKLMADLSGVKVKVAGWHYAGTADPADLLHRATGAWAFAWEDWLVNKYLDAICVGSWFHADLLSKAFGANDNVMPLGLAWQPDEVRAYFTDQKEKIVVFPHRLAPEKDPEGFYKLAEEFKGNGWRFVVSTNNPNVAKQVPSHIETVVHASKDAYYKFLATCSIYYSNATQETFGYAMHEAIALGLGVVAPDRCSYSEGLLKDTRFLFNPLSDPLGRNLLGSMLDNVLAVPYSYTERYRDSEYNFISRLINREVSRN